MCLCIKGQSIFLLCLIIPVLSLNWFNSNDKVLLSDIKTLTFQKGVYTQGRRLTPVPQLTCIGKCLNTPDFVNCTNIGFDGFDTIWNCSSKNFSFNRTRVECEGYDNQNDPYVVKNSCRLRYIIKSVADLHISGSLFIFYLLFCVFIIGLAFLLLKMV